MLLFFLCCCLLEVLWQKDRISTCFAFYIPDFSATHMHVELCDWLKFQKVTSSDCFTYLSARRSRLKTFIQHETVEEVSISSPTLTMQAGSTAHPTFCSAQLQGTANCVNTQHHLMADLLLRHHLARRPLDCPTALGTH